MASKPNPEPRRKKGDDHDDDGRPPRPFPGSEFLDQLPPDLRKEIEGLGKHERQIMQAMKDPKMNELFLRNPKAFFAALKIPVPPGLGRRLKNQPVQHAFLKSRSFRLPTGKIITPNVKVRFSGREREPED